MSACLNGTFPYLTAPLCLSYHWPICEAEPPLPLAYVHQLSSHMQCSDSVASPAASAYRIVNQCRQLQASALQCPHAQQLLPAPARQ